MPLPGYAAPEGTRDKEAELLSPTSFAAMPCLYGLPNSNLRALDPACMWIGDTTNSVPKTQHLHFIVHSLYPDTPVTPPPKFAPRAWVRALLLSELPVMKGRAERVDFTTPPH